MPRRHAFRPCVAYQFHPVWMLEPGSGARLAEIVTAELTEAEKRDAAIRETLKPAEPRKGK